MTDTLTYDDLPNPAIFNSSYNRSRGTRTTPTGGLFEASAVTNIENTYPEFVVNLTAVAKAGPSPSACARSSTATRSRSSRRPIPAAPM